MDQLNLAGLRLRVSQPYRRGSQPGTRSRKDQWLWVRQSESPRLGLRWSLYSSNSGPLTADTMAQRLGPPTKYIDSGWKAGTHHNVGVQKGLRLADQDLRGHVAHQHRPGLAACVTLALGIKKSGAHCTTNSNIERGGDTTRAPAFCCFLGGVNPLSRH